MSKSYKHSYVGNIVLHIVSAALRDVERCILRYACNKRRKRLDASLIKRERVDVIASSPFNQHELSVMNERDALIYAFIHVHSHTCISYFYDLDTPWIITAATSRRQSSLKSGIHNAIATAYLLRGALESDGLNYINILFIFLKFLIERK